MRETFQHVGILPAIRLEKSLILPKDTGDTVHRDMTVFHGVQIVSPVLIFNKEDNLGMYEFQETG